MTKQLFGTQIRWS